MKISDFRIETCMLFERASIEPQRIPARNEKHAIGLLLELARKRAAMLKAEDCPQSWALTLRSLRFNKPEADANGEWSFSISPGGRTALDQAVTAIVGPVVPAEQFWSTYRD